MTHIIQAVLFDLDGVIVFTDEYHYRAWKRLADEQGWVFNKKINHACRGVPRMASLEVILRHNNLHLSEDKKHELADRKNTYYKELLQQIDASALYPGAVELLTALKMRGVKLGLCSSSKNAAEVLRRLRLTSLFDTVVTGHDITHAKPHPEIFLRAAEQLKIHPFHCLVFEDAASGVEAAHAAGMKCIGVGTPAQLPMASSTVQDYAAIDVDALLDTGRPQRPPVDAWKIIQTAWEPRRARYWETIFALSNGLIGLRGALEEHSRELRKLQTPGMYLNGIYDYEPYEHLWYFPGFATHKHAMLNLPDWRIIHIYINGTQVSVTSKQMQSFRRELALREGVLRTYLVWHDNDTNTPVDIVITRLVSMVRRHSAAIHVAVTPRAADVAVAMRYAVDENPRTSTLKQHPHFKRGAFSIGCHNMHAEYKTLTSGQTFVMALEYVVNGAPADASFKMSDTYVYAEPMWQLGTHVTAGDTLTFAAHAAFFSSVETPAKEVLSRAKKQAQRDARDGFAALQREQAAFWRAYWRRADIQIDGAPADQQAVRFSLFHLRQSHPEDPRRSISANGMTGDHYCGHVFWDTEMYMLPHFLYTEPAIAKPLLLYRYHILDKARQRAKEMGGTGAMFSWNSISGEECGIVFEASTAEYHLQSDIPFAIARYVDATDDAEFLRDYGAEIVFETARYMAGRGAYIPHKGGTFCINAVCGPDEYGCGVNNNCYTNMLCQWHLRYAVQVYRWLRTTYPEHWKLLTQRLALDEQEVRAWQRAADRMYIPFNKQLGIHEQDDSFLSLDPVDMRTIPRFTDLRDKLHPLNLWRMQVAKQADVVLLMFVLGDQFSQKVKRANYEFYEPRTCHGSSLSACIHSIVAAEIGKLDDAYMYFRHSAYMDLNDFKNNVAEGVRSACLGGTWMAVVHGFSGMRTDARGLSFAPVLPAAWKGYRFGMIYRGRRLTIDVRDGNLRITMERGEPLAVRVYGHPVTLQRAKPYTTSLRRT